MVDWHRQRLIPLLACTLLSCTSQPETTEYVILPARFADEAIHGR
jgi:hypothetical protein